MAQSSVQEEAKLVAEQKAALACLYCGGIDFEPLFDGVRDRLGYVDGQWSFVDCRECGSANLRPFPRPEEVPGFYPPVYTFSPGLARGGLQKLLSSIEYRLFFQPVYRAQVRATDRRARAGGGRPGRLLDIGCGQGLRLLEFRRHGYDVCGMDFVPESVAALAQHNIPGVCTDIAGLASAYEPASFDVITAFYVLEHVLSVEQALRQCLTLLKPGGWFAGAVPLIDSLQAQLLGAWNVNVREAPRHISIPTRGAIRGLAASVGFEAESIELIPDPVLSCAGSASMSLVPASSTTNVYGSRKLLALVARIAGAAGVLLLSPAVAIENFVLRRPVLGILLAQRPR
jgi:SAM-dependent methyltransferase